MYDIIDRLMILYAALYAEQTCQMNLRENGDKFYSSRLPAQEMVNSYITTSMFIRHFNHSTVDFSILMGLVRLVSSDNSANSKTNHRDLFGGRAT